MAEGLVSGFLGTRGALQDMQSQQLRDALAIAQAVMSQRSAEHQKSMDEWQKQYQDRQAKTAEKNAETQEQWRKSSEERMKKKQEQDDIQEAYLKGLEMNIKFNTPFQEAFANLRRLSPERYAELEHQKHEAFKAEKLAEFQSKPSQSEQPGQRFEQMGGMDRAPVTPPWMQQSPQQQPAQPPQLPFMQQGMAAMGGPMTGMGAPGMPQQGAPMPMPQSGPMPGPMAQDMGVLQQPPMQAPPQFQEPTMQEALRQPSPYWLAEMQKRQVAADLAKARADTLLRGMKLKEEMEPAKLDARIESDIAREEIARQRADTNDIMVDAKIQDMKDKLVRLDRTFRQRQKVDENLMSFRNAMAAARAQTAGAYSAQFAANGAKAQQQFRSMAGLAGVEDKRATSLENMALNVQENADQAQLEWETSPGNVGSTDPIELAKTDALLDKWMNASQRYVELRKQSKRARSQAETLQHIAGKMQEELYSGGVKSNTGKAPAPTAPRMPAKPKDPVRAFTDAIGIP